MKPLVFLIALAVWGAGAPAPDAGAKAKADIRGRVTQLRREASGERVAVMLVEGTSGGETSYDKASVTVTRRTQIFRRRGRARSRAQAGALKLGALVEVRFDGPVLESYPVQATAGEIVILE
jgi:hypothetical protein